MFNLDLILTVLFSLIILPIIVSVILSELGNYAQQYLVNNYGNNSQLLIGGLGVIVHELAHLFCAIIFCHHIDSVSLLSFNYQRTHSLGHVNHSNNLHNPYENLGNFFIGLAPCFMCSEVLWLFHKYMLSNNSLDINKSHTIMNTLNVVWLNISHPFGTLSWQLLLYLLLIVMISSTGYGLSKADIHNSLTGLPYWVLLVCVLYCLITFLNLVNVSQYYLWFLIVLWLIFLGRGVIYLLITLVILFLIKKI